MKINPHSYDNSWEQLFRLRVCFCLQKANWNKIEILVDELATEIKKWNELLDGKSLTTDVSIFYKQHKYLNIKSVITEITELVKETEMEIEKVDKVIQDSLISNVSHWHNEEAKKNPWDDEDDDCISSS